MKSNSKLARCGAGLIILTCALTACAPVASTAQEERGKVIKARQIVEATGLEFITVEFQENTCKTDPPFSAYTGWMSEVVVDDGKAAAKSVSKAFSDLGWTQNANSWTDGEKLSPTGSGEYLYSDSYSNGESNVSIKIFKDRPKETHVLMSTPCKEQPADRPLEKDPEHPASFGVEPRDPDN